MLGQELWTLHSNTSVQPAACLALEDARSSRICHGEFIFSCVLSSKTGREASIIFAMVVLVKGVMICLWGLWSWCFSDSEVCMFVNKAYLAVWF